jgi:hypothetical protein
MLSTTKQHQHYVVDSSPFLVPMKIIHNVKSDERVFMKPERSGQRILHPLIRRYLCFLGYTTTTSGSNYTEHLKRRFRFWNYSGEISSDAAHIINVYWRWLIMRDQLVVHRFDRLAAATSKRNVQEVLRTCYMTTS